MDILPSFLLMTMLMTAHDPPKSIVCDATPSGRCRMTKIETRQMREAVYEGTEVAVAEPVATSDGDFRIFVRVTQVGTGKAEIKPKSFFGIYGDPTHTRFAFYDKAAEINQRIQQSSQAQESDGDSQLSPMRRGTGSSPIMGTSKAAKLGLRKADANGVKARQNDSFDSGRKTGTTVDPNELYLTRCTLQVGEFTEGFVYLRKSRRPKVNGVRSDLLQEIDIRVNNVNFTFTYGNAGKLESFTKTSF